MKPLIDIIIPSYNGKYLLEKYLADARKYTEGLNKVIIVDNGSTDGTIDWLNKNYPDTIIVKNKTNLGVTIPMIQGVSASDSEYFVLLNNDVRPTKDYLKDSLLFFKDKKVFAVSCNENKSSWPQASWRDGKLQFTQGSDKSCPHYSLWASGGSAIFKRSIWDKLGGMKSIYAPYYWEDIDIGYRAWKMGYKIIWNNNSLVHHKHESTSKKINQKYVNMIKQRNELLFTWMNISDKELINSHIKFLISHSFRHPGYIKVIAAALYKYIFSNQRKSNFTVSDREVLSIVNQPV